MPVSNRRASTTKAVLGFTLVLVSMAAGSAASRTLRPVDEGVRDASFRTFRSSLVMALRRNDREYLFSIVDPKMTVSFGSSLSGVPGLKEVWRLDEKGGGRWADLRETLLEVLALGGLFRDGEFWAPYVYSKWPDEVDAFEHSAITGQRVALRASPETTGKVLARLTYDLVKVPQQKEGPDGGWLKVIAPDGQEGYVARRYVRSSIDYRVGFKKQKGKWRMKVLVAGINAAEVARCP